MSHMKLLHYLCLVCSIIYYRLHFSVIIVMPHRHEDTRKKKNSTLLKTFHPFTASHKIPAKETGASPSVNIPPPPFLFSARIEMFTSSTLLTLAQPQSPSFLLLLEKLQCVPFSRWETKTQTCIDELQEETRGYLNSVLKETIYIDI